MHFGLTEEQEMIVSTVRSFVEKEIYPYEALVERSGEPATAGIFLSRQLVLYNMVNRDNSRSPYDDH